MKRTIKILLTAMVLLLSGYKKAGSTDATVAIEITGTDYAEVIIEEVPLDHDKPVKPAQTVVVRSRDTLTLSQDDTGTYRYSIRQKAGSDSNITYDGTVWYVDVYVFVDEPSYYSTTPVIYIAKSMTKSDKITFENKSNSPYPTPTPGPTFKPTASPSSNQAGYYQNANNQKTGAEDMTLWYAIFGGGILIVLAVLGYFYVCESD